MLLGTKGGLCLSFSVNSATGLEGSSGSVQAGWGDGIYGRKNVNN